MEVACRAIIFRDDKLLLCKQGNPSRDFWTLPGGGLYDGEKLEDCVIREVFEEVKLEVKIAQMLYIREMFDISRHRIEFYFLIREMFDTNAFDSIEPQNEIDEVGFFSLTDLRSMFVKPNCLPQLVEKVNNLPQNQFPMFLGCVE